MSIYKDYNYVNNAINNKGNELKHIKGLNLLIENFKSKHINQFSYVHSFEEQKASIFHWSLVHRLAELHFNLAKKHKNNIG